MPLDEIASKTLMLLRAGDHELASGFGARVAVAIAVHVDERGQHRDEAGTYLDVDDIDVIAIVVGDRDRAVRRPEVDSVADGAHRRPLTMPTLSSRPSMSGL